MSFYQHLGDAVSRAGAVSWGVVDIDRSKTGLEIHTTRYSEWIADGRHGAMEYLRRGLERRLNPKALLESAQAVFCALFPYPARSPRTAGGARYARYLAGEDYHVRIKRLLEESVRAASEAAGISPEYKVCVDTSAVLERAWAYLCGLGWIGKNTMLIHPAEGSYTFIGTVLLDVESGKSPEPAADFCGNCTRCLKACPTGALSSGRRLDSEKCISYWTLEKRGDLGIPEDSMRKMGAWIAGCDLCQEVCPFNFKRAAREEAPDAHSAGAPAKAGWAELLAETEEEYRARVKNSSLNRVKPAQFRRNLAIAAGNAFLERSGSLPDAGRISSMIQEDPENAVLWTRATKASGAGKEDSVNIDRDPV